LSLLDVRSYNVIYRENHYGIDPVISLFRVSVLICLLLAGSLIAARRVGLALLVAIVPIGFFLNFIIAFYNEWQYVIGPAPGLPDPEIQSGFLFYFFSRYVDLFDNVSLFTVSFLVVWYAWILVRSFRLESNRLA
jgi:hypothetical protein